MKKVPPYITFANQLQKDIANGKYGTEGGLPGADELAKSSGLSRTTIYKSLMELQHRNIIISRERTFFVNPSIVTMTSYMSPLPARAQVQGKVAYSENITIAVVGLPNEIADLLHIARGKLATLRFRVGIEELENGEKKPFRLARYYYLMPLSEEQVKLIEENPDADILVQYAPEHLTAHDEISARFPTLEEAKHLNISETTPVLCVQIATKDTNGHPLLFQELTLLGVTLAYDYSFVNRPK